MSKILICQIDSKDFSKINFKIFRNLIFLDF